MTLSNLFNSMIIIGQIVIYFNVNVTSRSIENYSNYQNQNQNQNQNQSPPINKKTSKIITTQSSYNWENTWKSSTNNQLSTTTTTTVGNIPNDLGINQAVPISWSYSYSYSNNSHNVTTTTTIATEKTKTISNYDSVLPNYQSPSQQKSIKGSHHSNLSPSSNKTLVDNRNNQINKLSSNQNFKPSDHNFIPIDHSKDYDKKLSKSKTKIENKSSQDFKKFNKTHSIEKLKLEPKKLYNLKQNLTKSKSFKTDNNHNNKNQSLTLNDSSMFLDSYQQSWLEQHNKYRLQYGVSELKWNQELVQSAKSQTEKCIWKHTENNQFGENIAAGQNTPKEVVMAWVEGPNEREIWNPELPTFTHFTQVVWKETTELGCAFTNCTNVKGSNLPQSPIILWACEYNPRGNVQGEYTKNVLANSGGQPFSNDYYKKK